MDRLSTLSDKAIIKFRNKGEIVIEPFDQRNLNTSSYDITLGEYYFRETIPKHQSSHIYNMYSKCDIDRVWGKVQQAKPRKEYSGLFLQNIKIDDKIILIGPGETILAHTNEFIGGVNHITTMMKSRSSLGRNFIETCRCAGWGDVGYTSRWTMEITNNSCHYTIPLVVGRRIAQIVFFDVGETNGTNYSNNGKYQTSSNLDRLKNKWKPEDMLPKMYQDFETHSDINADICDDKQYFYLGC